MPDKSEQIRRTTPEDLPALRSLFRSVFNEDRPERVWQWKFFEHPTGSWSWVFLSADQIVAHCGATSVRFVAGNRRILALQLVDFMSDRSYAGGLGGGGVFARMTATMFREVLEQTDAKLLYGFPGERHRLAGERLLGYTTAGRIGTLRLETRGDDFEPRPLTRNDLSRFSSVPSPLYALRDESLLRWRYLEHPEVRYEVVETSYGILRGPRGSAIIRREGGEVRLMEVGGSFAARDINDLVDRLSRLGAPVVGWCSPDHSITKLLMRAGFRVEPRDHFLAAAWFLDRPEPNKRKFFTTEPPRGSDFYISLGDYDVY